MWFSNFLAVSRPGRIRVVPPVPDGVPDGYRLRNLAATWPLPVPCTQAVRREGPGAAAVRAGAH